MLKMTDSDSSSFEEFKDSRVYANVNEGVPLTNDELENLKFDVDSFSKYKFENFSMSFGSYSSHVIEGILLENGKRIVMKKYLTDANRPWIVNREILLLKKLQNATNIIQLLTITKNSLSIFPSLIFEYFPFNFKEVYLELTNYEIRFYSNELLKGLDCCHSKVIIHRDLKPTNIVVDSTQKLLKIIDFGTAELYYPNSRYRNGGTQIYQPLEALLQLKLDYSQDLWSFGVILAEMLSRDAPFFLNR